MKSFIQFFKTNENCIVEQLLLEDRIDSLKGVFKDKLDTSHDPYAEHKDSDSIVNHFADKADPSKNKAHTQWVLNQYKKKTIRQEDHPRIRTALTNFETHKAKLPKRDINQYKSLSEIEDAVQPHLGSAGSRKQEKRQTKSGGADLIHDGPELTVHKLKTKEAACQYGAGTKWCTASRENNMFDYYNKDGPIYVARHKKTGEKHQFHFESNQFMDEKDEPVPLTDLTTKHPELKDIEEFKNKPNIGLSMIKNKKELNDKVSDYIDKKGGQSPENDEAKEHLTHPDVSPENLRKAHDVFKNADNQRTYQWGKHILSHPNLPKDIMKDVLSGINTRGTDTNLVRFMSRNPSMSSDDLQKYIDGGKSPMVADHPNLSSEQMHGLIDKPFSYRDMTKLTKNPSLGEEHMKKILGTLAATKPLTAQEHVADIAKHPNATDNILSEIINKHILTKKPNYDDDDDDDEEENMDAVDNLIKRRDLSPTLLKKLYDRSYYGRMAALDHPNFSKKEISKIINDPSSDKDELTNIARSRHAKDSDLLDNMIDSPNENARWAASHSKHLTSDHISKILSNNNPEHIQNIFEYKRKNIKPEHILAALEHPNRGVHNQAADILGHDYDARDDDSYGQKSEEKKQRFYAVTNEILKNRKKYKKGFRELLSNNRYKDLITHEHIDDVINDKDSSDNLKARAGFHPKATVDHKNRIVDSIDNEDSKGALRSLWKLDK